MDLTKKYTFCLLFAQNICFAIVTSLSKESNILLLISRTSGDKLYLFIIII